MAYKAAIKNMGARTLPRKKLRFWRWFRTIPILLCSLLIALSLGFATLPLQVQRTLLYPIKYPETIVSTAQTYHVDPYLICAIIKVESNWQDDALSAAGAVGLMQILPSTAQELASRGRVDARQYPSSDLENPRINIVYGTIYLSYLLSISASQDEAIAAYNAGPNATSTWLMDARLTESEFDEMIAYPETKAYVEHVNNAYSQYINLYPEGINA